MSLPARRTYRAVLAGCLAVVLGAGTGFAAPPAYADAGVTEVATVPAEVAPDSAQDVVLVAGATGFAHRRQGVDTPQWTDYATGGSRPLPWLSGVADSALRSGGGDTIVVQGTGSFTVRTADGDTAGTYEIPDGATLRGVGANGRRALVSTAPNGTTLSTARLLDLTDGAAAVPVTGLPDGAVLVAPARIRVDGTHAFVCYQRIAGETPVQYALLDMASGAATPIPDVFARLQDLYLTGTDLAWTTLGVDDVEVHMLPKAALLDGTADTLTPTTVTTRPAYVLAPVGGHLLAGQPAVNGYPRTVLDYRFGGGEPATALGYAPGMPTLAPDGSVLAVGGADGSSVAVHRYVAGADGALTDTTVLELPPVPGRNAGVALSHGYLRHVEGFPQLDGTTRFRQFDHALAADAGPEQPNTYPRKLSAATIRCQDGLDCVRGADDNLWGMPYLTADATGQTRLETLGASVGFTLPTTGGRIIDSDRGYAVVAGSSGQQYVLDLGQDEIVASGPATGAALWDATLWQAPVTATAGTVTATDLTARPVAVVRTISVGTCRPTDLQVAQHWLYWSCGVAGPAGVYDLSTGTKTAVPAGRALLGDGYVVRHDTGTGTLRLTDVHTGTAAPERTVATLPASTVTDDRGVTWAVDRFGGDLAHVDADDATHVLSPGVPASAPTAYVEFAKPWVEVREADGGGRWMATLTVSRPIDGWRLTISRASTGAVVHTATGGPSRGSVNLDWDMRLADGSMALSGSYRWQLSATVGGGTVPVGGGTGPIAANCGTRPFRSYDCLGAGAVLAVRTGSVHYGQAAWWQGTSTGTLASNGWTEDWQLGSGSTDVSALVPFGDINGDGYGDLLARTGDGVLHAHLGVGQASFGDATTVRLGGGYNAYTALLSVGDVDGDGLDDLLERDTSGTMWFKGGTGKTALEARVQIATGWNTYTRLAAIGDVNGDGRGDLLAVDRNNIVWRYYGAAGGTFPHRTQIATGWNTYNRIIGVGDLTGDGRPDLITRDSSGTVWRYDATTTATYPHRVKIATGWNAYDIF